MLKYKTCSYILKVDLKNGLLLKLSTDKGVFKEKFKYHTLPH